MKFRQAFHLSLRTFIIVVIIYGACNIVELYTFPILYIYIYIYIYTFDPLADSDECSDNNGGCDQYCINNPGSYSCACADESGFALAADRKSCHGECKSLSIYNLQIYSK